MEVAANSRTRDSGSPDLITMQEDGPSQSKRQRVSRACLSCRKSKLKCDGAKPRCSTCLAAKKLCSYPTTPRRRGLKTGYVRALECLWGLVFENIENSDETVENLTKMALQNGLRLRDEDNNVDNSTRSLLDTWRASRVLLLVDDALDASEDSEDESSKAQRVSELKTTLSIDKTAWSLKNKALGQIQHKSLDGTAQHRMPHNSKEHMQHHSIDDQSGVEEPSRATTGLFVTGLPDDSRELLDVFFSYTHIWLPVVERHTVFKAFYTLSVDVSLNQKSNIVSGDHAVLWAILAYTALRQLGKPSDISGKQIADCETIYTKARSLIPHNFGEEIQLGHIQALLFLALYRYSTEEWTMAWRLIGEAIVLAKEMGVDCSPSVTHKNDGESHKKVWLGCFALDTLIAAQRHRSPLLRESDVERSFPLDETGIDEWEPWRAKANVLQRANLAGVTDKPTHALSKFNHLIRILCILNGNIRYPIHHSSNSLAQLLAEGENGSYNHFNSALLSDGPFELATVPTNSLNLYIVQAYMLKTEGMRKGKISINCNTSMSALEMIISLTQEFPDSSILPPTCQLLNRRLQGPYTSRTDYSYRTGSYLSSKNVANSHHGPQNTAIAQFPDMVQQHQDVAALSDETPFTTDFMSSQCLNILRNAAGKESDTQQLGADIVAPWDDPSQPPLNLTGGQQSRAQWAPEIDPSDPTINLEIGDDEQTQVLSRHPLTEPTLVGLPDSEEWLLRYFDRIEDFERNDQEQFQKSLGYTF